MLRSIISKKPLNKAKLTTWTRQIRGAQPAVIGTAEKDYTLQNPVVTKIYTVRPVTFWMDKLLEQEKQRCLDSPVTTYEKVSVKKTMSDSYVEEYLPFKSSPALLDEYITTAGKFRIGKILEDVDAIAGSISYKHMDTFVPAAPVISVTASVDRMELLMPNSVQDFKLSGHVACVGKSSMEIFVKLETMSDYNPAVIDASPFPPKNFIAQPTANTVLFARITMVAVDAASGKTISVNPLITRNNEEKKVSEYAQRCKARKRELGENDLAKTPPTVEERLTLHELYMKYSDKETAPEDGVWMDDMKMQSVLLMQPQDRNVHNKVFGGYLMRRAYELAHVTGSVFAKSNVNLLSTDEVIFKKPVQVGSLLKLSSQIIYSPGEGSKSFQVSVKAETTDVETGIVDLTNHFHFSFASQDKPVRKILPRSYAESMLFIEGKRRRQTGVQCKKNLLEMMDYEQ